MNRIVSTSTDVFERKNMKWFSHNTYQANGRIKKCYYIIYSLMIIIISLPQPPSHAFCVPIKRRPTQLISEKHSFCWCFGWWQWMDWEQRMNTTYKTIKNWDKYTNDVRFFSSRLHRKTSKTRWKKIKILFWQIY